MQARMLRTPVTFAALVALSCGAEDPSAPLLVERSAERVNGDVSIDGTHVVFASAPVSELAGVVTIDVASAREPGPPLAYEFLYDYAAGEVRSDGHDARLDRASLRVLADAADHLARQLGPDDPTLPLHEQMLFAAFVVLSESGGMPLAPTTFSMDRDTGDSVDKSLLDDGIGCIQRGATYLTSFDFGSTQIIDTPIVADSRSCNGLCGPGCTRLTPFAMWTLDCLEHDTCCSATGDDTTCFTPLGECGDEFVDAEADFLRGFDPLRQHCGG